MIITTCSYFFLLGKYSGTSHANNSFHFVSSIQLKIVDSLNVFMYAFTAEDESNRLEIYSLKLNRGLYLCTPYLGYP